MSLDSSISGGTLLTITMKAGEFTDAVIFCWYCFILSAIDNFPFVIRSISESYQYLLKTPDMTVHKLLPLFWLRQVGTVLQDYSIDKWFRVTLEFIER